MSTKNRLRRLEDLARGSCSECRGTPAKIHAVYPGKEEPEPDFCSGCGRSLSVVIRVVYEDVRGEG
jgi:hypothetical protein